MRRRHAIAALGLTCGLAVAPAARADVADYLGKPIAAVAVEVEGRAIADAQVLLLSNEFAFVD